MAKDTSAKLHELEEMMAANSMVLYPIANLTPGMILTSSMYWMKLSVTLRREWRPTVTTINLTTKMYD